MEFLGDAVLGLVIADRVYNTRSDDEGGLTRLKSHLVSARTIYRIARVMNLGSFLRLGRGEEQNGGRSKRSLVVDAFEALIAAIYLDGGIKPAAAFIEKAFEPVFNDIDSEQLLRQDYKSFLQEICQARDLAPPDYTLVEESGPDHSKSFTVEVRLAGKALNRGQGKSKKSAEQAAARGTLEGIESGRIDLDTLAEGTGTRNHNGGDKFPSSTT